MAKNRVKRMEKTGFSVYAVRAENNISGEKHNWMCVTCGRVWLMRGFAESCNHTDVVRLADRRIVTPVRREKGELTDEQIKAQMEVETEAMKKADALKVSMRRLKSLIRRHVLNQYESGKIFAVLGTDDFKPERVKEVMEDGIKTIIEANEEEGSPLTIIVERIREVQLKRFNEGVIEQTKNRVKKNQ